MASKGKIQIKVEEGAKARPLSQVVAEVRTKKRSVKGKLLYKNKAKLNAHIHGIRP